MILAQCLASYFRDRGKFSMFFSVVFQASTGKKLRKKNHGKKFGTRKFDAKHYATKGNERKQVDLRFLSSKVEFVRSFLEETLA